MRAMSRLSAANEGSLSDDSCRADQRQALTLCGASNLQRASAATSSRTEGPSRYASHHSSITSAYPAFDMNAGAAWMYYRAEHGIVECADVTPHEPM